MRRNLTQYHSVEKANESSSRRIAMGNYQQKLNYADTSLYSNTIDSKTRSATKSLLDTRHDQSSHLISVDVSQQSTSLLQPYSNIVNEESSYKPTSIQSLSNTIIKATTNQNRYSVNINKSILKSLDYEYDTVIDFNSRRKVFKKIPSAHSVSQSNIQLPQNKKTTVLRNNLMGSVKSQQQLSSKAQ